MPIDPLRDEVFSLSKAPGRLPRLRNGRPANVSTLWRWATKGLRGVVLETAMVGGVRVTSDDALRRFFTALGSEGVATPAEAPHRRGDDTRAGAELDRLGI